MSRFIEKQGLGPKTYNHYAQALAAFGNWLEELYRGRGYPTDLAVERGLPPDAEAGELIGHLQKRNIDVAIWVNGIAEDTTYFACRKADIQRLNEALQQLEASGLIEKDLCTRHSERLFAKLAEGTEQSVGHGAADNADSNG